MTLRFKLARDLIQDKSNTSEMTQNTITFIHRAEMLYECVERHYFDRAKILDTKPKNRCVYQERFWWTS